MHAGVEAGFGVVRSLSKAALTTAEKGMDIAISGAKGGASIASKTAREVRTLKTKGLK